MARNHGHKAGQWGEGASSQNIGGGVFGLFYPLGDDGDRRAVQPRCLAQECCLPNVRLDQTDTHLGPLFCQRDGERDAWKPTARTKIDKAARAGGDQIEQL